MDDLKDHCAGGRDSLSCRQVALGVCWGLGMRVWNPRDLCIPCFWSSLRCNVYQKHAHIVSVQLDDVSLSGYTHVLPIQMKTLNLSSSPHPKKYPLGLCPVMGPHPEVVTVLTCSVTQEFELYANGLTQYIVCVCFFAQR